MKKGKKLRGILVFVLTFMLLFTNTFSCITAGSADLFSDGETVSMVSAEMTDAAVAVDASDGMFEDGETVMPIEISSMEETEPVYTIKGHVIYTDEAQTPVALPRIRVYVVEKDTDLLIGEVLTDAAGEFMVQKVSAGDYYIDYVDENEIFEPSEYILEAGNGYTVHASETGNSCFARIDNLEITEDREVSLKLIKNVPMETAETAVDTVDISESEETVDMEIVVEDVTVEETVTENTEAEDSTVEIIETADSEETAVENVEVENPVIEETTVEELVVESTGLEEFVFELVPFKEDIVSSEDDEAGVQEDIVETNEEETDVVEEEIVTITPEENTDKENLTEDIILIDEVIEKTDEVTVSEETTNDESSDESETTDSEEDAVEESETETFDTTLKISSETANIYDDTALDAEILMTLSKGTEVMCLETLEVDLLEISADMPVTNVSEEMIDMVESEEEPLQEDAETGSTETWYKVQYEEIVGFVNGSDIEGGIEEEPEDTVGIEDEIVTETTDENVTVATNPVDELFERLMSATTYEELDAMMEAMTEEEYVLLGQFSDEQNAALTALVETLSENPVEELPTQEEQEAYQKYLNNSNYPVYVTVIQGSAGFDGIPSEPAYYESDGYSFFQNDTNNGGYTTSGLGKFSKTSANVVSADVIKHANFIPSLTSDGVYGLADQTGVATMAMLPDVNFDKLLQGVKNAGDTFYDSDGQQVDKNNIQNYRVIPYVIKVQESWQGRGWHIDCILVKKGVILAYDLNLPEGVQISEPLEVAAPFAQNYVFQNGEQDHTFDIRKITNIRSDNTITVTLGNKSYEATFKGWNTEPDGSGTMYQPNGNITISKDTTLYAIWEFNPGLGRGDLLVRKTVVDADGKVVANDDTPFTFTLELPADDTENHTYTKYDSNNVSVDGGSIKNNGSFTLMNGQYVVIDDLFPKTDDAELTEENEAHAGWAIITETGVEGYTTTWKSGAVNGNATTVTIQDALVTSVICENKLKPQTTTITLDKVVTGNMGDCNKNFTFTVNVNDVAFETYMLNHNTPTITIENVPVGSNVTITESDNSGYVVSATVNGESAQVVNSTVTISNITENTHNVVFTNNKDVIVDTGILLDTLPYILILVVVVLGAILMLKKRRIREDD